MPCVSIYIWGFVTGGDSFLQGPSEESFDYQQIASDDSQNTQYSTAEGMQQPSSFHGAFSDTSTAAGPSQPAEQTGPDRNDEQPPGSPPDIKFEVTPMNYLKSDDFELIEIDEDDDI